MELNGALIKPFESIFVIAETASSHEGDVELAKRIADAVSMTEADAIKYQILNTDNLIVPNHHKYPSFKQLQFSDEQWYEIIEYSRRIGLFVVSEVFDERSFKLAEKLDISAYKIPTSDLTNPFLLKYVAATMKPLILSVGAATETEISYAIQNIEKIGNKNIILMHGFQGFPTRIDDTNFRLLNVLKERYPYHLGFADHIDAESELALSLPLVAIGYGVSVIEKHITLDRSKKGRDYYSALNPDEFARLVGMVRQIEKAYGINEIVPGESKAEVTYRRLMKKKIVASRDIPKGHLITLEDLSFKRTEEEGLPPDRYKRVLKKTKHFIPANKAIRLEDLYEADSC